LGIDDKILSRVVDSYRRIRNTLRFLLANTSDFDPAVHSVAPADLVEIDRWALARTAELQAEIRAHYAVYEFHPVVAKIQVFCSEDLGGFYLDVLKDRLYTTAANSAARRSAQTVLHQITHAMLRLIAPFLSFTAEEAWEVFAPAEFAKDRTIFTQTYLSLPEPDAALLARYARLREVRNAVNKAVEEVRAQGAVGSSLQAEVTISAAPDDLALLNSLGADLRFITITSKASLVAGAELGVNVRASTETKCERCWHYTADVGSHAAHPTLCSRCVGNISGADEVRRFA
jgi:isoleucyl-tRNA synthetase